MLPQAAVKGAHTADSGQVNTTTTAATTNNNNAVCSVSVACVQQNKLMTKSADQTEIKTVTKRDSIAHDVTAL